MTAQEQVAFQNGFLVGLTQKGVIQTGVYEGGAPKDPFIAVVTRPEDETRDTWNPPITVVDYVPPDIETRTAYAPAADIITYSLFLDYTTQ